MKRAAIYARYSSHNQREESIEIQLDNCRAYCAQRGWDVVQEYTDYARSGRTSDRAAFQQMMADARLGAFDVVVIWKVTRIMRNRDEMALVRLQLKEAGVEIAYAGEQFPDGASGMLLLGMMEVLAEWESAQTAERIRGGIRKNAERHQASGVRLFGYTVDEHDHFQIDPESAQAVRIAYDMAAGGSSIASIIRALSPYRSRNGRKFSHQSVVNMLRNERYTGVYSYAGVREAGAMPAIIDHDTFERVQAVLDSKSPRPRDRGHRYVLVGRLYDSNGEPMTGTSATGRGGKRYYYYRRADGKRIRCDVIERAVADKVAAALADSTIRSNIADVFDEFQNAEKDVPQVSEIKRVEQSIRRIEDAIESGLPFDRDRLLSLHERREELRKLEPLHPPRTYSREEVMELLESAAQMEPQRVIDVFVAAVVYDDDRAAVAFAFDDAPTDDEQLAQLLSWWRCREPTPTIQAWVRGVMVA